MLETIDRHTGLSKAQVWPYSSAALQRQAGRPRTQIRDLALEYIQGQIMSGNAAPGFLLRLAPVAKALGASTTPVREALLLLAQEGWVAQEPNRGFRVLPILRSDIYDSYLVYAWLAGELTARATSQLKPAQLDRLLDLDDRIRSLTTTQTSVSEAQTLEVQALNSELHGVIYTAANSPRIRAYHNQLVFYIPRYGWGVIPGWLAVNRDGHAPIVAALVARDGEAARTEMRMHVESCGQLLIAHLERVGFWSWNGHDSESPTRGSLIE